MSLADSAIEQVQIEANAAAAYLVQAETLPPGNGILIKRMAQDCLREVQRHAERAVKSIDRDLEGDMEDG